MSIDNIDIKKEYPIEVCTDIEKIVEFLFEIEPYLPDSLAKRVDFHEFAKKVVENGYTLAMIEDGKIISAIMFYCNDTENKTAYFTFCGTLPDFRKRGLSFALFREAEKVSYENGMRYVCADTNITNKRIIPLIKKLGFTMKSINGNRIGIEKELK